MLATHGRGWLVVRTWHDVDREAVCVEVNDDGPGVPQEVKRKICALKMPRVDGMTLYRAIDAAGARRVIFVTGDVAGTDAERFLEESGCRWLAKPFRLADLLRAVRDTLALA